MESVVIAAFVGFLLINLGLGLYQGRHVNTVNTYIWGKRFSTGELILTLTGTVIGASYFVWLRGGSHWGGGTLFLFTTGVSTTSVIATWYIFPKLRQHKNWYTLGDIAFQKTGSHYAQTAIDGIGLISLVILLSAQLAALRNITGLLGLTDSKVAPYVLMIVFTMAVIAYASRSGTLGVVTTDVLQIVLVLGGLAFITYKMLTLEVNNLNIQDLTDLWHQVKHLAGKNPFLNMFKEPMLPRLLIRATIAGLFLFSPAFIKRVAMANDNRQFSNSMIGFIIVFVLFMLMILVSGWGLFVMNGGIITENNMFPVLLQIIPDELWMRVLLLFMFLALVMSTADSVITAGALVLARIMISGLRNTQSTTGSAPTLSALRWNNLIIGVSALAIALTFFNHFIRDIALFGTTLLGGLIPFLVGISMGIKQSSKALIGSIVCFVVFFIGSIMIGEYVDFYFLDPNWANPATSPDTTAKYLTLLPFTILFSCMAYLLFEHIVHSGLKWEKRVRFTEEKPGLLQRGWLEAKRFGANPLVWAEEKVENYEARPVFLALLCIFGLLTANLVGKPVTGVYIRPLTALMLSVFTLCALLLTHEQWYQLPRQYFALFWLMSLVFCLPFAACLQYVYHPTMLTGFYLMLVPFIMHAVAGSRLGLNLSLIGYVLAFGAWQLTRDVEATYIYSTVLLALGGTTLLSQLALSYPMDRNLAKSKRPKLWTSAWAHDANHGLMEAQIETNEQYKPLPQEKKAQLEECKKRLTSINKHIQNVIKQTEAFRQLIVRDSIRPSEIVAMPLAEVLNHVHTSLKRDFQELVTIQGKAPIKVRVFLPIFVNILTNLIRNAYRSGATEVKLDWNAQEHVLYIKDNGPGIPQNELTTLFEGNK
ncbi:MAG: ATP-binding protein, partial [Bacteroidota bacterium]